ncbi:histidine kinase dimerization/phospho-acceptor domain-containing protein [Pseudorhodoplanes sp.]|uniref:sensor histidine kinase n=1 Tax=Pseudorhodoplanes sp. TaxID=1934341 RepID=UPI003918DF9A
MNRIGHDILRIGAVAAQASSAQPAWLLSENGERLCFANAAGAALLGHARLQDAAGAAIPEKLAAQFARIAASLRPGSAPQLARLRGLGTRFGRPLTCRCARLALNSGTALLITAIEAEAPRLTLADRARYLVDGLQAAAAFDAGGALLHAASDATQARRFATLTELGDGIETLPVGEGRDAIVLAFFPADSAPITATAPDAAASPALLDLSPIAEAITAMSKVPPQTTGPDRKSRDKDAAQGGAQQSKASQIDETGGGAMRHGAMRFDFETDAENRFVISSDEFIDLAGPRTANLLGRFWGEISAKLALDPEGLVAQALISRGTFSGIAVQWPTRNGRIGVTLSGIPVFDDGRMFRGYRGVGVWNGAAGMPAETPAAQSAPQETMQPVIPEADAKTARPSDVAPAPVTAQAPVDTASHDDDEKAIAPEAVAGDGGVIETAPAENVVPFPLVEPKPVALNPAERSAFRDLGSRLSARLKGADELARGLMEKPDPEEDEPESCHPLTVAAQPTSIAAQAEPRAEARSEDEGAAPHPLLDRLPFGVLIDRGSHLLYANKAFLAFAGHESLEAFAEAGGLDAMFVEMDAPAADGGFRRLRIAAGDGSPAMEGHLVTAPIDGENAMVLVLQPAAAAKASAAGGDHDELAALLDLAVDGIVTIDRDGTILRANARAETLFGYEAGTLAGRPFGDLFAPESERAATARLIRLARGEAAADEDGRDIIGRRRNGGLIWLQLTLGKADASATRFHALFRDMTRWKDAEKEMTLARQQAEKASAAKSEFLAKISHEMRTPLNAILGFSEVMMEERFGPVGNERYSDYLKDIHTSGTHLVSLLNDLLDLSKIEAGKLELSFERVDLNEVTQQSVAIMQPQANRARVIVRSALSMNVPGILADTRSVRQIVLNLLSNSIKFTGPGGQVIVSTAINERGDVVLRVRDTGVGMSEKDIETALQPFRQLTTSPRSDANGTGLGLPLTKALVEANRARFSIKSAVNAGTLVEIVFPVGRVLAA